jgi:Fe-S-cluster-containing hydrogenase component 2
VNEQHPLQALQEGHWFKLICGASFQHLPAIQTVTLAYTLAGADCIDVAADPAVILAAQEAIEAAVKIAHASRQANAAPIQSPNFSSYSSVSSSRSMVMETIQKPLLMVSLNDGEDPHFRKAEFDAAHCPPDCPRPCEWICPAGAIGAEGVFSDRCYGCGRCVPICPIQQIFTRSYVSTPQAIAPLILEMGIDGIEIHTQVGRFADFQRLWTAIQPWVKHLQVLAISCPDGDGLLDYLRSLYDLISPLPCPLIWQTDGRPMSGDIGTGATRASIKLGQKVLTSDLPGYVQLAGGTNHHTVPKLRELGLLPPMTIHPTPLSPTSSNPRPIAGVAYGSYARTLLAPILSQLEHHPLEHHPLEPHEMPSPSSILPSPPIRLSAHADSLSVVSPLVTTMPDLLEKAVKLASSLVSQLKSPANSPLPLLSTSLPLR